jgi:hypothetical protein
LAWLNRPAQVWVGQTDPVQPSLAPLTLSRASLAICITAVAALPLRPSPTAIAIATLGKSYAAASSTSSTKWFRRPLSSRGDRIGPFPQDMSPPSTSAAATHRSGACTW